MAPLARLFYAFVLTIVTVAAVALVVSVLSADVIALASEETVDGLLSPFGILGIYAIAWLVSPWVAQLVPVTRTRRGGGPR